MNGNGYQKPARLPKLAMTDIVHGWWPGVGTHCAHCAGRLWLNPPTLGVPGSIACLLCDRETHTVLERVYEMPDFSGYAPKLGRPPVEQPAPKPRYEPIRECVDCGALRSARINRPRCRDCEDRRKRQAGHGARVLAVLAEAQAPLRSHEIAVVVGLTPDAVRRLIGRARRAGAPVVNLGKRKGYRLRKEMAS